MTLLPALESLLHSPLGWLVAGIWGALWGSFFNVCIHRVGLYESVLRPRSRCPRCGSSIAAYDNVPILSWLALRGRCRSCKAPVSLRYPLVEALSAGLAIAVYWKFVADVDADPIVLIARFLVYFAFAGTLLVISGIDFDHQLIPDRITYPAIPLFLLAGILVRDYPPLDLLLGAVIGYGIVALTIELSYALLKREGMGYGDAKLLALIGALLGWRAVLASFFASAFLGLLVEIPVRIVRRKQMIGAELPFGPYIAAAALLFLFFADRLRPYF